MSLKTFTVYMQQPVEITPGVWKRKPTGAVDAFTENLLVLEEQLRRLAYSRTTVDVNESFFDDSDMSSEYRLVIIYDKNTGTPLLSARYYYDQETIFRYLKGDQTAENALSDHYLELNINDYGQGTLFLADRLSGNLDHPLFQQQRARIFLLFYLEMYKHNKTANFILMARKEKTERLLTKYLRLGLTVIGTNSLRGKVHWNLLGNMSAIHRQRKLSIVTNSYLLLRIFLHKITRR
jgi:hypothetical protein